MSSSPQKTSTDAGLSSPKKSRIDVNILDATVEGEGTADLGPGAIFAAHRLGPKPSTVATPSDVEAAATDPAPNPAIETAAASSTVPAPLPGVRKVTASLAKEQQPPAGDLRSNSIGVNKRQRGNPLLKLIRSVPWQFQDVLPDFVLGRNACALFLSVRYHSLHPDYIHNRLRSLGNEFELRILLVLIDNAECSEALKELNKICLLAGVTLILSWTNEEAARYLECYKSLEFKPPDLIMERAGTDFMEQARDFVTCVKSVNKADVACLIDNFGPISSIVNAEQSDLEMCPGLGRQKAQRLRAAFTQSFSL